MKPQIHDLLTAAKNLAHGVNARLIDPAAYVQAQALAQIASELAELNELLMARLEAMKKASAASAISKKDAEKPVRP